MLVTGQDPRTKACGIMSHLVRFKVERVKRAQLLIYLEIYGSVELGCCLHKR